LRGAAASVILAAEMNPLISSALDGLRAAGWTVELQPNPHRLPPVITERYAALPPLFVELATRVRACERGDETVWILTASDYAEGGSSDGFGWNTFETMMLDDPHCASFWTRHLPILQAVYGDYEYLAIDTHSGHVVWAYVNSFDDTLTIAPDFADFLRQVAEVGAAKPTAGLVAQNSLALLIHEEITDDGSASGAGGFLASLAKKFGL
jgi:hypothetical protein